MGGLFFLYRTELLYTKRLFFWYELHGVLRHLGRSRAIAIAVECGRGSDMRTPINVDVDELIEISASAFPSWMQKKRPLVIRKAAQSWGGSSFFQSPQVNSMRTTWRLHPLCDTTVLEVDCFFLEASVGQFLRWERSLESLDEADNPFARFDRKSHWAYADYKHVKELSSNWMDVLKPLVDWSALGCDKDASDSTVWLGTEGSHTPLHQDTYGVNLVAQLHGRKKWLLFSPDETARLYPTRVPYEESSVFSRVDPSSPNASVYPRFSEAQPLEVTLEPGDVLYVPKHWWHFVEAVDTSLSINVWVDAPDDAEDRAKEALARVMVTSLAEGLTAEVGQGWLNPAEGGVWPLEESLQVAHLAFQDFDTFICDRAMKGGSNDVTEVHRRQRKERDSFSVRAMVDAITAPDVLSTVMERLMQGRERLEETREGVEEERPNMRASSS